MKKLSCLVLAIIFTITMIPTVSAKSDYVFEADNIVGSASILVQVSTDGVAGDTSGGTAYKSGGGNIFSCGLGTWSFTSVANSGYRFAGWETKLVWDELEVYWDHGVQSRWLTKTETNPSNQHAHVHAAGRAYTEIKALENGGSIKVNHIACNAPSVATLKNFKYIMVAKFERIPASLTVKHVGVSIDQFGKETSQVLATDTGVTGYKVGQTVTSADVKKGDTFQGYTYAPARDESLKLGNGSNTLSIYYTKDVYVNQPASVTVKHMGYDYTDSGSQIGNPVTLDTTMVPGAWKENDSVKASDYVGQFQGYNSFDVSSQPVVLKAGPNEVTIKYKRMIPDGSYLIKHVAIDKWNGQEIRRSNLPSAEGTADPGTVITAEESKNIPQGYTFDGSDKASITVESGGVATMELRYVKNLPTATATIKHIGVVYDQDGQEVTREDLGSISVTNAETVTITPADYKADFGGYEYANASADSMVLGSGTNEATLFYTKQVFVQKIADVTVIHKGATVDSDGNVVAETELLNETVSQEIGGTVSAASLQKDFSAQNYTFAYGTPESLKVQAEGNQITLTYTTLYSEDIEDDDNPLAPDPGKDPNKPGDDNKPGGSEEVEDNDNPLDGGNQNNPNSQNEEIEDDEIPMTGDMGAIGGVAGLMLASAAGIAVIKKRKANSK